MNNVTPITIALGPALRDQVDAAARDLGHNRSSMSRVLLREALAARGVDVDAGGHSDGSDTPEADPGHPVADDATPSVSSSQPQPNSTGTPADDKQAACVA